MLLLMATRRSQAFRCSSLSKWGCFSRSAKKTSCVIVSYTHLDVYKRQRQVTVKGQADYVTQVDFAVQSYLKERRLALHPQAGFLAEEQENVDYSGRPAWIHPNSPAACNGEHSLHSPQDGVSVKKNS